MAWGRPKLWVVAVLGVIVGCAATFVYLGHARDSPERRALLESLLTIKNRASAGMTAADLRGLTADLQTKLDLAQARHAVPSAAANEIEILAGAMLATRAIWVDYRNDPPCYYKFHNGFFYVGGAAEKQTQDCVALIRRSIAALGVGSDRVDSLVGKQDLISGDALVSFCLSMVHFWAQKSAEDLG